MKIRWAGTILVLLSIVSCGKRIDQQVKQTVRTFDNLSLSDKNIEVQDVRESGGQLVAQIKVTTAVKMIRKDGKWVIDEIRIGDRQWEKADHVVAILNQKRSETTRRQMNVVSASINRYLAEKGTLPEVGTYEALIDVLSPGYLGPVIRVDAWSNPFRYRALSQNNYELRSAGPDGAVGTQDDLIVGSR